MTSSRRRKEPIGDDLLAEVWFSLQQEAFEALSKAFRAKVESAAITQREVAELLDMDEGQLSRIMTGDRRVTLRSLCNIAFALGQRVSIELRPIAELPRTGADFESASGEWAKPRVEVAEGERADGGRRKVRSRRRRAAEVSDG